ncbi:MAG: hypothetical protein ACOX8E_03765 [Ruminococcus sp.]|jgi:hypothetical protein
MTIGITEQLLKKVWQTGNRSPAATLLKVDDSSCCPRANERRLRGNIDKIAVAEENIINLTGLSKSEYHPAV